MTAQELADKLNRVRPKLEAMTCAEGPDDFISVNAAELFDLLVDSLMSGCETSTGIEAIKVLAPHLWHGP